MTPQPNSFAYNATVTAATNLLLGGIGLLTGILAARTLGAEGRGELAAIQLWPALIATLAMLGLPESLVYFCARERQHSARYVATAMVLVLGAGGVFIGIGYWAMPMLLGGQSPATISAARAYLAIVPIAAIAGFPVHAFRGRGEFLMWNALRITPNLVWLVILVGAATLGITSAQTVANGFLWSLLVLGLFICCFFVRRIPGPYLPRCVALSPLLRFGIPSMLTTAPNLLATRLDQMLLVAFMPPTMLGLYVVALGWAGGVTPMLSAIASATFPRVAEIEDQHVRNLTFARAVRMTVIAACFAVLPVALLAPLMLPLLFGASFSLAVTASVLLTISAAITGVNQVLEEGLRGVGRPASILLAQAAGLPVSILAMLLLLPRWGLEGAGIAVVCGAATMCLVLMRVAQSETGFPIWQFCVPTMEDFSTFLVHGKRVFQNRLFFTGNRK